MSKSRSIPELLTDPLIDAATKLARKPFEIAADLAGYTIKKISKGMRDLLISFL